MKKKWVAESVYLIAVLTLLVFFSIKREDAAAIETFSESGLLTEDAGTDNGSIEQKNEQENDFSNPDLKTENEDKKKEELKGSETNNTIDSSEAGKIEKPQPTTGAQNPTDSEEDNANGNRIIANEDYEQYDNTKHAWWFVRKTNHIPSGSGEALPITTYDGYYLDKMATEENKVIYLTFDCGYENGYTPRILDILARQEIKALFFVTKDFIVKNPEYVIRMKEEGHLVGNHTVRHLSSPDLTPEELNAELNEVAQTMYTLTGYEMDPYFRPPMGEYSERTLKVTQDLGYSSIFWSIAYYDYDVNDQPGKDYVIDHFKTYHHNGAIILMHNVSESNAEALEEVVEMLKEEGYRFGEVGEWR